jgi:hypothetical protein
MVAISIQSNRFQGYFQIAESRSAIWDAQTQTLGPITPINGFGSGHGAWSTQAIINNTGENIVITKTGSEMRFFDQNFSFQGSNGQGMAWGTLGDWESTVVFVEANGDEATSNRISILDTSTRLILDTIFLSETIGINE